MLLVIWLIMTFFGLWIYWVTPAKVRIQFNPILLIVYGVVTYKLFLG